MFPLLLTETVDQTSIASIGRLSELTTAQVGSGTFTHYTSHSDATYGVQ